MVIQDNILFEGLVNKSTLTTTPKSIFHLAEKEKILTAKRVTPQPPLIINKIFGYIFEKEFEGRKT